MRIRSARKGETIKTLDGNDRALQPDMLVIAVALAIIVVGMWIAP